MDVEGVGAGANMALRRSAIGKVGLFDERLDAGTPTRSAAITRCSFVCSPRVITLSTIRRLVHRVAHPEEVVDTIYGYGVGVYAMWTGLLSSVASSGWSA